MLLTKEVIIRWSPRNKNYLISKGYIFSKYGDEIVVNTNHLTNKNSSVVEYECDICKCKYSTTYDNYRKNFEKYNSNKCRTCSAIEHSAFKRVDKLEIINLFNKFNLELISDINMYKNNNTKLYFKCNKHNDFIQYISYNKLRTSKFPCKICNNENISFRQRGDKSHTWKGGISTIHGYLRRELKTTGWYYKSFLLTNFKCLITGDRAHHIHHLYSFNKILEETISEFNIQIKSSISEYTDDELLFIKDRFLIVHNRYPLGVALRKDIHKKYHQMYGDDNNESQFKEFRLLMKYDFGV